MVENTINYELVYTSTVSPGVTEIDIANLLNSARDYNAKNNITGCLLYHNNNFIQILEGDKKQIKELYAKIKKDERHFNLVKIIEGEKNITLFKNWAMAYRKLETVGLNSSTKLQFADNYIWFEELSSKPSKALEIFRVLAKNLLQEENK